MMKFICLLLLSFTVMVKGQNLYPVTNTFKVINYEIQQNNDYIQLLQNGVTQWKKTIAQGANEIRVYIQSLSVQQLLPAGDLCSPTFFLHHVKQLTAILTNGRSCPIQAGTTVNLLRSYTENTVHPLKSCLGTDVLNYTLYDKLNRKKLFSLEVEVKSSGQACTNG